jgi:type VI secretion system secreted protein VgrG
MPKDIEGLEERAREAGDGARPLTAGEIELAKRAFRDRIRYEKVKIRDGAGGNPAAIVAFRNGNWAITIRRTIYFGKGYSADFAAGGNPGKELFLHEMTHIWQWAELGVIRFGLRYGRELASMRFDQRALYHYLPGETRYSKATLEAQAQMVGNYGRAMLDERPERMEPLALNLKGSRFYDL